MSANTTGIKPFLREGVVVVNSLGREVCRCVGMLEAKDVSDALNYWANKPEEITDASPSAEPRIALDEEMTGMCGKCLTSHHKSYIGKKCVASSECGGTVTTMVHAEQPKPEPPQPNREETDRVAAKYYESGRKLEVQYFNTVNGWCVTSHPHFDYSLAWRLTPKRRRVVVEVYKLPDGSLSSVLVGSEGSFPGWRLLGTIEGEVEA